MESKHFHRSYRVQRICRFLTDDPGVDHCKLIQENYIFLLERLEVQYSLLVAQLFDNGVRNALPTEAHILLFP